MLRISLGFEKFIFPKLLQGVRTLLLKMITFTQFVLNLLITLVDIYKSGAYRLRLFAYNIGVSEIVDEICIDVYR